MAIQTGGYGVQVMPQLPAVDPRLYAFDPNKISQGAMQAFEVMGTMDKMKAFRSQQAELAATQQARIAQQRAISELAVMQAESEHQLMGDKIAAAKAELGFGKEDFTGRTKQLGDVRKLESAQRTFQQMGVDADTEDFGSKLALSRQKTDLEKRQVAIAENDQEDAQDRKVRDEEASIKLKEAQVANFYADALKARAAALAAGTPEGKGHEAWLKSVGETAAVMGMPYEKVAQLYASGAVNQRTHIPLASEFAALSELMKKPNFWLDPYDDANGGAGSIKKKVSPELLAWMGGEQALDAMISQAAPVGAGKAAAAGAPAAAAAEASIPKIKVNKDFKIVSKPKQAQAAPAPVIAPATQAARADMQALAPAPVEEPAPVEAPAAQEGSGVDTDAIIDVGMVGAQAVRGAKALKGMSIPLEKRAALRLAGSKLAGSAIGQLAPKILPAAIRGGSALVGAATGIPATAAYIGNKYGGQVMGKIAGTGWEDGENVVGMEYRALNADSYDEQLAEAKEAEMARKISDTFRSGSMDEEQKAARIEQLLTERETWRNKASGAKEPNSVPYMGMGMNPSRGKADMSQLSVSPENPLKPAGEAIGSYLSQFEPFSPKEVDTYGMYPKAKTPMGGERELTDREMLDYDNGKLNRWITKEERAKSNRWRKARGHPVPEQD